jgi:hypothetical protein
MRVWKVIVSGSLAAMLLLTAVAPAIAAPEATDGKVFVQFTNQTGSVVHITLTGPATVYLTLATGKTKSELVPGIYHYSYFACNSTLTGTFRAKHAGANLVLRKCPKVKGTGEAKIKIKNETGATMVIYLTGPQYYTFYVATGTYSFKVQKGKYQYTAYGCGGASTTGTIRPGSGVLMFWCY